MSSSYRISLENWLDRLDVHANVVLDFGGAQLPIEGRTRSWNVDKYFIADLPEPHADSPKPDFEIDINEPFRLSINGQKVKADIIFALELYDYVFDPVTAMRNVYNHLKLGGVAYISFPTFYPTHNPIEDDALCYKEGGIRKLADKVGLTIVDIYKRRPETNAIEMLWRNERMRAAKHYDHNFTGFIITFKREK